MLKLKELIDLAEWLMELEQSAATGAAPLAKDRDKFAAQCSRWRRLVITAAEAQMKALKLSSERNAKKKPGQKPAASPKLGATKPG